MRLDSNIESKSSNITFFNIIEIFNKLKIFENHRIQNFSDNIDLRKQVFLSAEKISERSGFVNKVNSIKFVLLIPLFVYKARVVTYYFRT